MANTNLIEVIKGKDKFYFTQPLANDEFQFKIDYSELLEQVFTLQDEAKALEQEGSEDVTKLQRLNSKLALFLAKIEKLSYEFLVTNIKDVDSKEISLEDIKAMRVPISYLKDVSEAFRQASDKVNSKEVKEKKPKAV